MYDLVKKCNDKTLANTKTCTDIISAYCYVFYKHDRYMCLLLEYPEYEPKKQTTGAPTKSSPTTPSKPTQPTTTASTASTRKVSINVVTSASTKYTPTTPTTAAKNEEDPFVLLRTKCSNDPKDDYCVKKRSQMTDLINKCEEIKKQKNVNVPKSCGDIVSIYCFVFSKIDKITCTKIPHSEYVPIAPPPTTKSQPTISTTSTTTRTTTTKPNTSSTTTVKVFTTSKGSSSYPFELIPGFKGTITELPTDSAVLKQIGDYCVRSTIKEKNCDLTLTLIKGKFKECEKKPASDKECQTFKLDFCKAYPKFQCCAEVLAGKPCKSSSTNRRELFQRFLYAFY